MNLCDKCLYPKWVPAGSLGRLQGQIKAYYKHNKIDIEKFVETRLKYEGGE